MSTLYPVIYFSQLYWSLTYNKLHRLKVDILISFDIYVYPWNEHQNQGNEYIHHTWKFSYVFFFFFELDLFLYCSPSPIWPHPQEVTDLLLAIKNSFILLRIIYILSIILVWICLFLVQSLSLGIIASYNIFSCHITKCLLPVHASISICLYLDFKFFKVCCTCHCIPRTCHSTWHREDTQ